MFLSRGLFFFGTVKAHVGVLPIVPQSEDPGTLVGNGDGMLEVRR